MIRRLKERLSGPKAPRRAADVLAAAYVLLGLRYTDEFADALFEEVLGMEESSTYRAIVRREGQEAAVRHRVQTMAPRIIHLDLDAVRQTLIRRQLQTVVVAVGAGIQLRHLPEARIFRLLVREWREASRADRLITVHLRLIRLIDGARADILRPQIELIAEVA